MLTPIHQSPSTDWIPCNLDNNKDFICLSIQHRLLVVSIGAPLYVLVQMEDDTYFWKKWSTINEYKTHHVIFKFKFVGTCLKTQF